MMPAGQSGEERLTNSVGGEGHDPTSTQRTTDSNKNNKNKVMSEDDQRNTRASIKEIMKDNTLTDLERRRSIQNLMDGRQSSTGDFSSSVPGSMSMIAAATHAAAQFYDSDDDHDNSNAGTTTTSSTPVAADATRTETSQASVSSPMPYTRKGRSAALKDYANGAAQVAAAAAAAMLHEEGTSSVGPTLASIQMEKSRPHCSHYQRNCSIISPCCGIAFGCRICHDECPVLPPPIIHNKNPRHKKQKQQHLQSASPASLTEKTPTSGAAMDTTESKPKPKQSGENETHHEIDRFAISEIICRFCYTRQSSKTNQCISCGVQFGEYHCSICNLWMSKKEKPFHCPDCGVCRVGGAENYRHCHDCGMCIDLALFESHNCEAGKFLSHCPVCQEDLFLSRSASHEMPCGHTIHWHCFQELTAFDTRCPVCKKTAETRDQMASTWSAMAVGILIQPVPPEMARVVTIICNDCEERDKDRQWHFLGVQCQKCGSFNTTVESTSLMGMEAAHFTGGDRPPLIVSSRNQELLTLPTLPRMRSQRAPDGVDGANQQQQQQQAPADTDSSNDTRDESNTSSSNSGGTMDTNT